MKRSRHRWLGLTIFCILLTTTQLPITSAVRATSLIFAKTTSTAAPDEAPSAPENGTQSETTAEGGEATPANTTSKLTGIPQLDYIYDPNLPRELNGYNLSEYPFYGEVPPPETMDFKCDGLHDGFYASVPHKCQVYHHCLFGTRYDFLCANYTAFDQKTFICHFVSEVDCKNSPNYWSRNEALYKATTAAPPPPPATTTTTTTPAPPRRSHPRRRPYRPVYDDDYYDDYEYSGSRRRPERGRGRPDRRPDRRPYDDDDEDDYRYQPRTRPRDEADDEYEERRPYEERRRPGKRTYYDQRRPYDDDRRSDDRRADDRRPVDDRRTSNDRRALDDRRTSDDRKALDDRRTSDDRKALDDRRTSDDRKALDNRRTSDDRKALDGRRTSDDRKAHDDRRMNDDRREERRPVDDRITEDRKEDPILDDDIAPVDDRRPIEDGRLGEDRRPTDIRRPGFIGKRRPGVRTEDSPRDDDRPRVETRVQNKDEIRVRDEPVRSRDDSITPRDEIRPRDVIRPREKPRGEIRPRDEIRLRDENPYWDSSARDEIRPKDEIRPRDEIKPRDEIRSRDKAIETIRPRDTIRSRDEIRPRDKPSDPREETRFRSEKRTREEKPQEEVVRPRPERRPSREDVDSRRERPRDAERYEGKRYRENRPYRDERDRYRDDDREEKRTSSSDTPLVKPNGRGIFSQPRLPPKIKRPVPINEKDKYDYIPVVTTKAPPPNDEYYYEEYEDEDVSRPSSSGKSSVVEKRPIPVVEKEKFKPSRPHRVKEIYDYDYESQPSRVRNKERPARRPSDDDYDIYYDEKIDKPKKVDDEVKEYKVKDSKTNVKVFRRPFLPSRAGSPYMPRGLQPVGGRNLSAPLNTTPKPTTTTTTTTTTTPSTTTSRYTTTTEEPTTTRYTTTEQTTTYVPESTTAKPTTEDYEYYEEDDIDEDVTDKETTTTEATIRMTTTTEPAKPITTTKLPTTTTILTTPEERAKHLATKVLKSYNDNYEAIQKQLESSLSPGDYLKPYLATSKANIKESDPYEESFHEMYYRPVQIENYGTTTKEPIEDEYYKAFKPNHYEPQQKYHMKPHAEFVTKISTPKPQIEEHTFKPIVKPQPKPEISKPYLATGKPVLKNIYLKKNLADSIENDYDVRLNEALAPSLPPAVNIRTPSGFVVPFERNYNFNRLRVTANQEPQHSASELTYSLRKRPQVSIRTPSSYILHPQRYFDDDIQVSRMPRQLVLRNAYLASGQTY